MKRTLFFMLLSVCLSAPAAWASDFETDGIYYNILSYIDNTVEVTFGDEDYLGDVIIPATVAYEETEYQVTSIGASAFNGCSGLISLTIPNSIIKISTYAFSGNINLERFEGRFAEDNGCSLIVNDTLVAFAPKCKLTEYSIPEGITVINPNVFYGCTGLTSVTIPNSIIKIGNYAFYDCTGLKSVTIPNSVTTIGTAAFYGCTGLTSVMIPNSVTTIGRIAFTGCGSLTSVTIGESVTSIGASAFSACDGLTSVTVYNTTPPEMYDNTFDAVSTQCTLYVPVGSEEKYKSHDDWKNSFYQILPIEGYVSKVKKDFKPATIIPADKAEVTALKTFILTFTEAPNLIDTTAALLNEAGTLSYLADLTAGEGNTLIVTLKCDTLTAAGTYTLTIPEGAFGDAAFAADPTTGHCNPTLTYTYTIKEQQPVEPDEPEVPEQDFEPVMAPETGSEEISFTRATLTFTEAPVLLDNRVMLAKSDSTVLYPAFLAIGEGNTLEITLRYGELKAEGTYLLNIPVGTVSDTSGKHVNPEYSYIYTLKQEAGSVPTPKAEAASITVYNLQGILMLQADDAAELKTLPAGDYIVNGKKMIIVR